MTPVCEASNVTGTQQSTTVALGLEKFEAYPWEGPTFVCSRQALGTDRTPPGAVTLARSDSNNQLEMPHGRGT